ncbi:MAG TPA: hypothetical protein VF637_10235 [Sphingomicrobium sp.]
MPDTIGAGSLTMGARMRPLSDPPLPTLAQAANKAVSATINAAFSSLVCIAIPEGSGRSRSFIVDDENSVLVNRVFGCYGAPRTVSQPRGA